jgi:hypothetical protein
LENIMAEKDPICCGFFAFFAGLALLYSGVQKYLLLQKITNTPTSKVRSAAVGLVELHGKAICKDPTHSPITKQKCAWWRLNAEYYQSGKHGGWRTIMNAVSGVPFYLEDDTGKILVKPLGAQIDIPMDHAFTGYITEVGFFGISHKKLPQPVLDYIESSPPEIKKKFMAHNHQNIRVHEYFIAEGDPLYVLGTAQPKEGAASAVGHENLVVGLGKHEKAFYISDTQEKNLVEKMKGEVPFAIVGGLAASAAGLLIVLWRLGV